MTNSSQKMIILGHLASAHGVNGWIKIHSFTEPNTNILKYNPWHLSTKTGYEVIDVEETRVQGPYLAAKLKGCDDRETAKSWTGRNIAIPREALPECGPEEFYWTDLEGLTVKHKNGAILGKIDGLMEAGAKDIMLITGDKLWQIPFILHETVMNVDLEAGEIIVDWEEDE